MKYSVVKIKISWNAQVNANTQRQNMTCRALTLGIDRVNNKGTIPQLEVSTDRLV